MARVEPASVREEINTGVLENEHTSQVSDDSIKLFRIPLDDFSEEVSNSAKGSSDGTSAPPLSLSCISPMEKIYVSSDDEMSIDKASIIVGSSLPHRLMRIIFGKKLHIDQLATSEVLEPYFLILWRVVIAILAFATICLCIVYIKHPCCTLAPITYGILVLVLLRGSLLAFKRSKIQDPRMLDYERPKRVQYSIEAMILRAAQLMTVSSGIRMMRVFTPFMHSSTPLHIVAMILSFFCMLDLFVTPAESTIAAVIIGFLFDLTFASITVGMYMASFQQNFGFIRVVLLSFGSSCAFYVCGFVIEKYRNMLLANESEIQYTIENEVRGPGNV